MRIDYFKAKNFIGIYSGTGKTEIEIDFKDNNKNDTILLLGTNGCGKSSLMSILHPFRETFDIRKNIILDGKEGYKEIHLRDKNDIYIIKHHYGKISSKNKSYISKNNVELNENGNITSFMDILSEKFNLTKEYFTIGKIGSNVEGFIGLSTANRKTYINKFIPNIDEYLEAFEIVNEKYKEYNKDIKSLKSSLDKINEDELLMKKTQLETEIKSLNESIKSYEKLFNVTESKLNDIKEELKDIPENLEELYNNATNNFNIETNKLNSYLNKYPKLKEYNINSLQSKINENNIELSKLNESELNINTNILRLEEDKENILSDIIKNKNLVKDSYVNFIKPSEIKVEIFNQTNEKKTEESKLKNIETELNDIGILDFIKNNEYSIAKSECDRLISTIQNIRDSYPLDIIDNTDILNKDSYILELNNKKSELNKLVKEHSEIKNRIFYLESNYEKYNDIYKKKPNDCINNSCIFIKDANIFMTKEYPNLKLNIEKELELSNSINKIQNDIDNLTQTIEYILEVNKYIIKDIESYSFLSLIIDFSVINQVMKLTSSLESQLNDYLKLIKDYNLYTNSILRLESSINNNQMLLETNTQKELLIKEYENNIENLQSKFDKIEIELNSLKENKDQLLNSITIKNNSNKLFNIFIEILSNYNNFEEEYNKYNTLFLQNNNKLTLIKSLTKDLETYNSNINLNQNEIIKLTSNIENVKNQLFLFKTYSEKLNSIENEMQNLELVKDALDPKKGIPLIFMTNYLNVISASANKLLDKAYNGDFKIAFKVTAKEFLINVFKSDGTILNDISEASQGELSLTTIALSLAMMENLLQNCKYNILYLDEVDATLSTSNRRIFLELLKLQMEKNIEQCFVISHNDEFYSQPIDLILFKENNIDKDNEDLMSNKNILWEV